MPVKWRVGGLGFVLLSLITVPTMAFEVKKGETLGYKVIIKSVIHGGDQTVKIINDHEVYQGAAAIRIRSTVNTLGVVNQLTGYAETEEMVLDAEGLYPLYLKRETKDNKGTEVEQVCFDYRKKIAVRQLNQANQPEERTEIELPGIVHDGLSLQFFIRKPDLKPGSHRLYFYSNGSGKIKDIHYSVREVRQTLKLENKTYPEYLQIQSPKVNITILLSNDAGRVPLLIRKVTKVGKFEAKLVSATDS